MAERSSLRVAVVGACASGKSTLVAALREAGYDARHVVQEHSYVPDMWKRVGRPDVLVYLDVDYETIRARRPRMQFVPADLAEQKRRLDHARQKSDLYLDTGEMSPAEVEARALSYLEQAAAAE